MHKRGCEFQHTLKISPGKWWSACLRFEDADKFCRQCHGDAVYETPTNILGEEAMGTRLLVVGLVTSRVVGGAAGQPVPIRHHHF